MNFDTYKTIVENSKIFSNKDDIRVTFCGEFGDPMMHPRVTDFVEFTAPRVKQLVINTNGGLRQPEWYAEMAPKWKHFRINWGIDGTDHDTNWLYREGVNFERAMENMKAWFAEDGHGEWQFLIFDWNWHQIVEAKEMAEKNNIKIRFKFNNRDFGRITDENRKQAYDMLRSIDEI